MRMNQYKIALLHCKSARAYISLSVHFAHAGFLKFKVIDKETFIVSNTKT